MIDTEKYQKLAEEYAKLKQHNAILKKAVRDEQEKSTRLERQVLEVETRLHQTNEDHESLIFNNTRLTKRVSVLQDALQESENKSSSASSSGWFGSGTKQELAKVQQQLQVVKEELEVKIRENEELHMQIFEKGQETQTIQEDLKERLNKIKLEVKSKTEELEDLTQQHNHAVTRLTTENQKLTSLSDELGETLVRTKSLMQQREVTMTQTQQRLTSDLEFAQTIISSKVPFNDTIDPTKNVWNLPHFVSSIHSKRADIISSGITLFKKWSAFWKDWCDAEHEKLLDSNRVSNQNENFSSGSSILGSKGFGFSSSDSISISSSNISSNNPSDELRQINRKIGNLLSEFHPLLALLTASISQYVSSGIQSASGSNQSEARALQAKEVPVIFGKLVLHFQKTSNLIKSKVEQENTTTPMFTQNEAARKLNEALGENWMVTQIKLEKLATYLGCFFSILHPQYPDSDSQRNAGYVLTSSLSNLMGIMLAMNSISLEIKKLFSERASIVSQLITMESGFDNFMSNDVKVINSKRSSSLTNAASLLDKICDLFSQLCSTYKNSSPNQNINGLSSNNSTSISVYSRGAKTEYKDGTFPLLGLEEKSKRYMSHLSSSPKPTSIPYEQQLSNVEEISKLKIELASQNSDLTTCRHQISSQISSIERLQTEIVSQNNLLAQKQTMIIELNTELAEAKSKISHLNHQLSTSSSSTMPTFSVLSSPKLLLSPASSAISSTNSNQQASGDSTEVNPSTPPSTPPPSYNSFNLMGTNNTPPDLLDGDSLRKLLPIEEVGQTTNPPSYRDIMDRSNSHSTLTSHNLTDLHSDNSSLSGFMDSSNPFDNSSSLLQPSSKPAATATTTSSSSSSSSTPAPSVTSSTTLSSSSINKKPWTMSVSDEHGNVSDSLPDVTPESIQREEMLRMHFDARIQQFLAKIDSTDRKNVELYHFVQDLEKQLRDVKGQREDVQGQLQQTLQLLIQEKEEVETTRASYDGQLKTLTEHMVSLSDKVASTEDELSVLKNSTVRCGRCKAWNTIGWLMTEGKGGQRCSHGNHPSSFNYS